MLLVTSTNPCSLPVVLDSAAKKREGSEKPSYDLTMPCLNAANILLINCLSRQVSD